MKSDKKNCKYYIRRMINTSCCMIVFRICCPF